MPTGDKSKTSEARSKIRAWFKKERREENIVEGKIELEKELRKNYIVVLQSVDEPRKVVLPTCLFHELPLYISNLYGIYSKVYKDGRSFDEVYDIYAVRIIVDTDIDCYNIFGVIHDMFTPIPGRFIVLCSFFFKDNASSISRQAIGSR